MNQVDSEVQDEEWLEVEPLPISDTDAVEAVPEQSRDHAQSLRSEFRQRRYLVALAVAFVLIAAQVWVLF